MVSPERTLADTIFRRASLESTLADMRHKIREFLLQDIPYETWESPSKDRTISDHIKALRIPCVKGKPRLLLHDLGKGMVRQEIIDDVFRQSGCVCYIQPVIAY
jgi:hypothetical protein